MTLPKPYQYRKIPRRPEKMRANRQPRVTENEVLTGVVQGSEASDIEERFAKALYKNKLDFDFQVTFSTAVSLPGEEKRVDFVVHNGLSYPIDIDGQIGHKTSGQQGKDAVREAMLNEIFAQRGMALLQRVKWTELETQEDADRTVRRMFL